MTMKNRIIIDTDPGVDDVWAMLLAFSANPEDLEVLLISITHGNVDVGNCLRNVVSLFHLIGREQQWRILNGRRPGFDALAKSKPIVAVGAQRPLAEQMIMADYFHGKDGLGGIHTTHPHLTPTQAWELLFDIPNNSGATGGPSAAEMAVAAEAYGVFTPSKIPSHKEILRILRENEENTITIVAMGPLTNLAIAAAEEPLTFLRVKEVVVMGGAINAPGNITPVAEFNTHADTIASARVWALSALLPESTMPLEPNKALPKYPEKLPSRLNITLFPLDITVDHYLTPAGFDKVVKPLIEAGSPLAEWTSAFMSFSFPMSIQQGFAGLSLHDPLTVWYAMDSLIHPLNWTVIEDQDIRIETTGQWSRGTCVVDRRGWPRLPGGVAGDRGRWLDDRTGNRLGVCIKTPGEALFEQELLRLVFMPDL